MSPPHTRGFYLGVTVTITERLGDGWCWATWPDGRAFKHWAEQIKTEPFGSVPA